MIALVNRFLAFSVSPEQAMFSLSVLPDETLSITQARIEIETWPVDSVRSAPLAGNRTRLMGDSWPGWAAGEASWVNSVHGRLNCLRVTLAPHPSGVRASVEFALAEDHPLCLWRVNLENLGPAPALIHRITLLQTPPGATHLGPNPSQANDLGFFSNGWQSWSPTSAYHADQAQRHTRLSPLVGPMLFNAGTPQPSRAGHYGADFFGVLGDRRTRQGWLAGFLSQKQHFGSLEVTFEKDSPGGASLGLWANGDEARLDPGCSVTTDWGALTPVALDDPDPLAVYLDAVARENFALTNAPIYTGWCSWYQYGEKVTAQDIQANLKAAIEKQAALPLNLFQIDDGFESRAGDWFASRPSFPDGVAPFAAQIRQAGMTPGLWLAPFLAHPRSHLAQDHPELLLTNARGHPVNAGFVWNTLTRALDLSHPQALAYATEVVDTAAHQWGFPYLKLDFLYAGALTGKHHDPTLTRAQILRRGLEALRAAAGPETYLLGCGVPLGSAIGLVQAMRIGEDTADVWRPRYFGAGFPFRDEWAMPSARNALLNTLTRATLHRRWWVNDPDCLQVRSNTHLTAAEIQSQATALALTGGALLISDNLAGLDGERLALASAMTGLIGKRGRLLDWFDSPTPSRLRLDLAGPAGAWHLLGLFNWSDLPQPLAFDPREFDLPAEGSYWAYSHWDQQVFQIENGKLIIGEGQASSIPAHGAVLLGVRAKTTQEPVFLGSSLGLSQGLEVSGWQISSRGLRLSLELARRAHGSILLYLPRPIARAWQDEQALIWKGHGAGCYSFELNLDGRTDLKIETAGLHSQTRRFN